MTPAKPPPRYLSPALALVVALTAACGTPKLDRSYGKSTGASINGTRVFFDLLSERGHVVKRVGSLRQRFLDDANAVIWFEHEPDGVPWTTVEEAAEWLAGRSNRQLVYVANDFDSDLHLWEDLADHYHATNEATREEKSRALHDATASHLAEQAAVRGSGSWAPYPFASATAASPPALAAPLDADTELARDLSGRARIYVNRHPTAAEPPPETKTESEAPARNPDTDGDEVDGGAAAESKPQHVRAEPPGAASLRELRARVSPSADSVWLASDARPLVLARRFPAGDGGTSQVVLVHNGSFLLNYALLDAAHRTLATRLADHLGEKQRIAFYEPSSSSRSSRAWFWGDRPPAGLSPLDMLFRPPLGWVFLHLLIAALLYLASQAPIFGRPRGDSEEPGAPFTQHVRAYGKLLERTGDRRYVERLLAEHARRAR